MLTGHFKPSQDYSFPKSANGRSFQHRWLERFPWLVYSKQENGGICLPCASNPGVLVSRPLTTFAKALELLADQEHHKAAVVRADEFMRTMTSQQPSIQTRINKALADRISLNRQKLASIMKTIRKTKHTTSWPSRQYHRSRGRYDWLW